MYEHTSFTYDSIVFEQKRIDRANELRRVIAESPSRVVPRAHPIVDRMRGWFRVGRTDAAAADTAAGSTRVICDPSARPAHAR